MFLNVIYEVDPFVCQSREGRVCTAGPLDVADRFRTETRGLASTEASLLVFGDGEVGGPGILYLTPPRYTVTTRMTLH